MGSTKTVTPSHCPLWDYALVAPEIDRGGKLTGWALWVPLQIRDVNADAAQPSRPLSALLSASLCRDGFGVHVADVQLVADARGQLALELSVLEEDFQAVEAELRTLVDEAVGQLSFLAGGMRLGSQPVQNRAPRPRLVRREGAEAAGR